MDQDSGRIKIAVVGQDGKELVFKIHPNKKLLNLLKTYCARKNLNFNEVRFYFVEKAINRKHTAAMLGMQNNDKIEAMMEMTGGGGNLLEQLNNKGS